VAMEQQKNEAAEKQVSFDAQLARMQQQLDIMNISLAENGQVIAEKDQPITEQECNIKSRSKPGRREREQARASSSTTSAANSVTSDGSKGSRNGKGMVLARGATATLEASSGGRGTHSTPEGMGTVPTMSTTASSDATAEPESFSRSARSGLALPPLQSYARERPRGPQIGRGETLAEYTQRHLHHRDIRRDSDGGFVFPSTWRAQVLGTPLPGQCVSLGTPLPGQCVSQGTPLPGQCVSLGTPLHGQGWSNEGRYYESRSGAIHDTTRPRSQPCFNRRKRAGRLPALFQTVVALGFV